MHSYTLVAVALLHLAGSAVAIPQGAPPAGAVGSNTRVLSPDQLITVVGSNSTSGNSTNSSSSSTSPSVSIPPALNVTAGQVTAKQPSRREAPDYESSKPYAGDPEPASSDDRRRAAPSPPSSPADAPADVIEQVSPPALPVGQNSNSTSTSSSSSSTTSTATSSTSSSSAQSLPTEPATDRVAAVRKGASSPSGPARGTHNLPA